jgi:hypothetical protein
MPNPFMFAGQWYDNEISQYYMRARQYDPRIGRFTARDPAFGGILIQAVNCVVGRLAVYGLLSLETWLGFLVRFFQR